MADMRRSERNLAGSRVHPRRSAAWWVAWFSVAVCAADGPPYEGFEGAAVPPQWRADESADLSISDTCFKNGRRSLRWQWRRQQSVLTFRRDGAFARGAEDAHVCFYLWVYNPTPGGHRLRFEIGAGRKPQSTFDFGLRYKGWRVLYFSYRRNLSPPPRPDADTLRIISPPGVPEGVLYLDSFCPALPAETGFLAGDEQMPWVNPDGASHWVNYYYHFRQPWPVTPLTDGDVTPAMRLDMRKLSDRYRPRPLPVPARPLTDAQFAALVEAFDAVRIQRHGKIVSGRPLVALNLLKDKNAIDIGYYLELMGRIAVGCRQAKEPEHQQRLRRMFFDLCDHLHEQGIAEGSVGEGGMHHLGYKTRSWPAVVQTMAEELAQTNRLEPMVRAMNWYNDLYVVKDPEPVGNADAYLTKMPSMLAGICMLPDGGRKATFLRCFSRWISKSLVHGVSDPDGAFYHHNMVHPGYTFRPIVMLAEVVRTFSTTSFRIGQRGHERLKQVVFAHTFVCHPETPRGVAGRCPGVRKFDAGQQALLNLALSGTPDGKQPLDPDMAGLWLALHGNAENKYVRKFRAAGVRPRPLVGNLAFQGAAVSAHRRKQWVVTVDGCNRYRRGTEFYGWTFTEHSWARYLNLGTMQILSRGDPMTRESNGWPVAGWDSRHWPGTTVVALPGNQLYCYYGATNNRSPFAGGCDLEGNGAWGIIVDALNQKARKSVFFFDNRLICLGSGITNQRRDHPTVTTLFQTALTRLRDPLVVDGDDVSALPYRSERVRQPAWVLDPKGNGYYIPPQDSKLVIARRHQIMTYFLPKYYLPGLRKFPRGTVWNRGPDISKLDPADFRPTAADYALAWFDHGAAPREARYEYVVIVHTDRAHLERFAGDCRDASSRPYQVVQHEDSAHIVHDRRTDMWGFALFVDDLALPSGPPLRHNGRACMVMLKRDARRMKLSVASSERDRNEPYQLTLAGRWELRNGPRGARVTAADNQTRLVIPYENYCPVHIVLAVQ